MEIKVLLNKLDTAINQLLENEHNILQRGLNELNLNGHLARYLGPPVSGSRSSQLCMEGTAVMYGCVAHTMS